DWLRSKGSASPEDELQAVPGESNPTTPAPRPPKLRTAGQGRKDRAALRSLPNARLPALPCHPAFTLQTDVESRSAPANILKLDLTEGKLALASARHAQHDTVALRPQPAARSNGSLRSRAMINAAVRAASTVIQRGATSSPSWRRSAVNITSGTTANGSCRLRTTWLRINSCALPFAPYQMVTT